MKYLGFVLLGLFFFSISYAQGKPRQKVVLLTSVAMTDSYRSNIEKIFRNSYEPKGYDVVVIHHADQYWLHKALHDPYVVGLFWLSHTVQGQSFADGVTSGALLLDEFGFDVSGVIGEVHPNLRFLALVGCESEKVLRAKINSFYLNYLRPNLDIATYDQKVEAKEALQQAINTSWYSLNTTEVKAGYFSKCFTRKGVEVEITRKQDWTSPDFLYPSVRIELGGEVLGVFMATLPGFRETKKVFIRESILGKVEDEQDLKFIFTAGSNLKTNSNNLKLGQFFFNHSWDKATWQVFGNKNAKGEVQPEGINFNVYQFTGDYSSDLIAAMKKEYQPFVCVPMPPL